MANLKPVDEVVTFDSDKELEEIIKNYQPDVMLVGSDWEGKEVIGSQYAKQLVFFPREIQESTTATIENYVRKRFNNM